MNAALRRAIPAVLLATGLLTARQALAETRLISGTELVLSVSHSSDVVINADPSLHGQIRLTMASGLSCVSVATGYTIAVSNAGCDDDGTLQIDVSPDAPMTLSSSGDGDIHLADLHAKLTVVLSGSGDLVAGRTGPLVLSVRASGDAAFGEIDGPATIDMNGNGDVKLKALHGPLTVKQVGSGDLAIGSIQASSVALEGSGSGDFAFGAGHIEALEARLNGSGDLSIAATMRDATVDVRGGGDVKLGPVSGTLNKTASDDSDVVVLDAEHARAIDDQVERKFRSGGGIHRGMHLSANGMSDLETCLTLAFMALVAFLCWRIVRRAGGLSGMRRQWRDEASAVPTNPGVLALGETMTRLEQRLGRLESYVTTREFDLARKFREMGP